MAIPVLVIEDDKLTELMLTSALTSWGYAPVVASSAEQAEAKLSANRSIRLVILDWRLPGVSGVNFCRSIRECISARPIYVILLTSRDSLEDQFAAFETGVDDFIVKPFHPNEIRLRLRAGAKTIRQLDQTERINGSIDRKASRDNLTGVGNRESILNALSREMGRQQRTKRSLSVMSLDLDHFKAINDTMGHAFGDAVLRVVGDRLSSSIRGCDICGRTGGDEFLIVLPETSAEEALQAAKRLYNRICTQPVQLDDRSIPLTCSVGVTTAEPDSFKAQEIVLSTAEDAMYLAKRSGGARIQFQCSSNRADLLNINPPAILCSRSEESVAGRNH